MAGVVGYILERRLLVLLGDDGWGAPVCVEYPAFLRGKVDTDERGCVASLQYVYVRAFAEDIPVLGDQLHGMPTSGKVLCLDGERTVGSS